MPAADDNGRFGHSQERRVGHYLVLESARHWLGQAAAIKRRGLQVIFTLVLVCGALPGFAQSGGPYALAWSTIDGGGATFVEAGGYRLGGTAGQPDAGASSGTGYAVTGGFWAAILPSPSVTPTATPTSTRTATPTSTRTVTIPPTASPTATSIPTAPATPTGTRAPTPSATPTVPSSRTSTPSTTPTPSATQTPSPTPIPTCVGNCNGSGQVTVDKILTMVNIALGSAVLSSCPGGDANHDGQITVDEILMAVHNALKGCNPPLSYSSPSAAAPLSANAVDPGGMPCIRFAPVSFRS
jgi:hypothetical protein